MKILLTEPKEIHTDAVKLLKEAGHSIYLGTDTFDSKDIEVIFIRTYTLVTLEFLNKFPALKYILRAGVGLDGIDLAECKKRSITVLNSPGANANAVAEFVVATTIMLLRNASIQSNELKNGKWRNRQFIGSELKGKTIGFVGCGAIAKSIIEKLKGFSIGSIVGYDPYLSSEQLSEFNVRKVSLEELLKVSDIVSLHLPLTDETKDLISTKELQMMEKTSYLINTSRGGIANESDLVSALENGTIAGAALDVFENEPTISKKLLASSKLLLTPHVAGFTREADRSIAVDVVNRFLTLKNG
ncbi:MAG: NAD(P)-dependent oxidoreductase [Patescibacteria group bacterium]